MDGEDITQSQEFIAYKQKVLNALDGIIVRAMNQQDRLRVIERVGYMIVDLAYSSGNK